MEIRERIEENEKKLLSIYAVCAQDSLGRETCEPPCAVRTCFQRDNDRIIHSKAFRRLKHKTQVFLSPEGDHYRTRLTHTLEVAQIARTIARALRLNEDLTEAIAMGHDLGHTPFGHAGERELKALTDGRFTHMEQSLRVVEKIERLNLTFEVKNGIRCHSGAVAPSTLEGKIVHLSDRIAYINHDIDDSLRAGLLNDREIPSSLGATKRERINTLVLDVVRESLDKNDILMSSEVEIEMLRLREFLFERVYRAPHALREEIKVRDMIAKLYRYFMKNIAELPDEFREIADNDGEQTAVCDYIACMTDRFAVSLYKSLFIPKFTV